MELVPKVVSIITGVIAIISTLYYAIKSIIKYLTNNPESKLKIFGQSIITSFATYVVINGIALILYFSVTLNFSKYANLIEFIAMLLVATVLIIIFPLFIVKDWYKNRNAFVIAEDYKLFNNDQRYFSEYSKITSESIANDFINNTLDSEVKLNDINTKRKNMHSLSKVSTRYNVLSVLTWFSLPLLALNLFILLFGEYDNKIDFVIIVTIISISFIIINSFVIYFDTKLQYGIVDHTSIMVQKHDKKYRNRINKQTEKVNKNKEETK